MNEDTRIYLSWGTNEAKGLTDKFNLDFTSITYNANKKIEEALLKEHVIVNLYCQVGGYHCEADWEKQNPLFMNFLWKNETVKNI